MLDGLVWDKIHPKHHKKHGFDELLVICFCPSFGQLHIVITNHEPWKPPLIDNLMYRGWPQVTIWFRILHFHDVNMEAKAARKARKPGTWAQQRRQHKDRPPNHSVVTSPTPPESKPTWPIFNTADSYIYGADKRTRISKTRQIPLGGVSLNTAWAKNI